MPLLVCSGYKVYKLSKVPIYSNRQLEYIDSILEIAEVNVFMFQDMIQDVVNVVEMICQSQQRPYNRAVVLKLNLRTPFCQRKLLLNPMPQELGLQQGWH